MWKVSTALRLLGYGADEVAHVLRFVYGFGAKAAAGILKAAGFALPSVAGALKSVFGAGAREAVEILKEVFGVGADVLEGALDAAGYAAGAIEDALGAVFGAIEDVFCGIFGC